MQGRETLNMKLVRGNSRKPKVIDGELMRWRGNRTRPWPSLCIDLGAVMALVPIHSGE